MVLNPVPLLPVRITWGVPPMLPSRFPSSRRAGTMIRSRRQTWHRTALLGFLSLLAPLPGMAQTDIPRTRTHPGLETSPFPYVSAGDLGLSIERMDVLTQTVVGWVRENAIVGAEILLVKDRNVVLHETVGWSDKGRVSPFPEIPSFASGP